MHRKFFASILAAAVLAFFSTAALAAVNNDDEDTDLNIINARVVEVAEGHISVIARDGVEHVIKIDNAETKVMIEGQEVSLKDVREGDVITVELDEQNPVKFARTISMSSAQVQVAKVRR